EPPVRAEPCEPATAGVAVSCATAPLQEPDAVERPVGGEGPPDDPSGRDRSPEPAVVGFPTVVAHHEPVTGGNPNRCREVALRGAGLAAVDVVGGLGFEAGLSCRLAKYMPVADVDFIAGSGHDALD